MLLITSILGVCFLFVSFRFEERNNKEYIRLAKMLTEYVPKGSVVMTRKPEIFYYYTGIKAVPYPQKVVDTIDVDYVLVENSPGMANIARFVNGKRLLLMVPDKYALVKMRP